MLSPSQLCSVCFAVFVANFTFSQVEGNSFAVIRHNNTILTLDSGFSDHTRCIWNCTIIDSSLPEQRNSSRLIELVVEYKKKVTKQCVNQALNNSSGNVTESFIVWSPGNNQLASIHRVIQHWFELIPCPDTTVHIKAVCRFVRDLGTRSKEVNSTFNNSIIMYPLVRSHLKDHGFEVRTSTEISQNSIVSHFTTAHIWLQNGIIFFVLLFCYTIVHYFLGFLCLFSPTLVHENGLGQIILEGASPVSFRSLVGNYFFSEPDSIGHRVGKVILRLMVLPFTLIALAVILLYYSQHHNLPYLHKPLEGVCVAFFVILFTYNSFCKTSHQVKTCILLLLEKSNIVHDVEQVPRRILTHLRIQPLILKIWWSFLCTRLIYFFKMSRCILPSRKVSLLWFFRVGGLLVFLSVIIPAVTFMFLTAMLVATLGCVFATSPAVVLLEDEIMHIHLIFDRRLPFPLILLINLAAGVGFECVLSFAALGLTKIVGVTLIHLLSEESLPFNTLLALICYYLWNSYSHFTNKYHDLSIMLYKCYQKHRPKEISDETAVVSTADPVQAENKPIPESKCSEIKIPQQLFDMACEELMPIRESVWKLILEIVLILFLFFMAFALTSLLTDSVTYVMKSLVTVFTGLFPKIVAIFMIDRGRKLKHEAMVTEEKVQWIVQRYITGNASAEQDQDSFGANTEELIIHVDNEAGVVENSPI